MYNLWFCIRKYELWKESTLNDLITITTVINHVGFCGNNIIIPNLSKCLTQWFTFVSVQCTGFIFQIIRSLLCYCLDCTEMITAVKLISTKTKTLLCFSFHFLSLIIFHIDVSLWNDCTVNNDSLFIHIFYLFIS